jgi:hypothetical protein
VCDFNTTLSSINKKIHTILELNNNTDQMDVTDIYRIFHQTTAEHISSQQPMEPSSKQVILGLGCSSVVQCFA